MTIWCSSAFVGGRWVSGVRLTADPAGRIAAVEEGVPWQPGDLRLGTVLPGMGNAHSHAFHRLLRGRTHSDGGDFWQWRGAMYRAANALDPIRYFETARAVFSEMLLAGFTAVGEFHYLHHRPGGAAYPAAHAMELALCAAAREVGIRLVLLDSCYLAGGIGVPLSEGQLRFGDGSAERWMERWYRLRDVIGAAKDPTVTLGASVHSVRAVPPEAITAIAGGIPSAVPLHIHVSEQPQENRDCVAAYGLTPVALLAQLGALSARTSLVHATHLTSDDEQQIVDSEATVVICPTTEADLGDGIGPARELANAGTPIAIGSDQNAVIDPFLEMRGLEMHERLESGQRGRFTPQELLVAASTNGYRSLGLGRAVLAAGDHCDLVEVSPASLRTAGSAADQLVLSATAADVLRVIVGGRTVVESGRLVPAAGTPAVTTEERYAELFADPVLFP